MPPKIVLGSSSIYRRALLERLIAEFETCSPDIDESPLPTETPIELVRRLALAKAEAVAQHYPDALIIASDQVAVLDQEILGKPGTAERAFKQLRACSGHTVTFQTSLCLYQSATQYHELDVIPFAVTFRALSDRQIHNYIDREAPLNCAGSFKSEGLGIALFESMSGSDPNALIGLPLIRLVSMLQAAGVVIL